MNRLRVSVVAMTAMFAVLLAPSASAQIVWTCNGVPATIVGTPDADSLEGTPGPDVIVAREGDDRIMGLGGDYIICAGKGDDEVVGGEGFDIMFGAQGDDVLYSAFGSAPDDRVDSRGARMFGGAGNDTIHGSNRWDRMQGGLGQDELYGYEGRDWMRAGGDNDLVDGGLGIDDLHGGNGRDTIALTAGDIVRGGAGFDLCTLAAGQPGALRSCGLNTREVVGGAPVQPAAPLPQPDPQDVAPIVPRTAAAAIEVVACDTDAETVTLRNTTDESIRLAGWTLLDEGPNFTFELGQYLDAIPAREDVVLVSGPLAVDPADVVRIADRHVWNNAGDTASLFNPAKQLVSEVTCDT